MGYRKRRSFLSLACGLCAAWAPNAVLAAAPAIAVLPFNNSTGETRYQDLSEGFALFLAASLSQHRGVIVVDRSALEEALKDPALRLKGWSRAEESVKLGKIMGAGRLVTGGFSRLSSRWIVDAHVLDTETAQMLFSERMEGESLETISEGLASKLALRLKLPEELRPLPADERPDVHLHFIRGLGYFYGNLYDHAAAEFMEALFLDPHYSEARFWLAKSYFENHSYGHAKIEFEKFLKDFPDHPLSSQARESLAKCLKTEG